MKKLFILISLTLFSGMHLSSFNVSAQNCTQLSLPENAIARFCWEDQAWVVDLDYSPDGKTLASVTWAPKRVVLWNIENKTEKLTINGVNGRYVMYSPDGKTLVCGDVVYDAITGEPKLLLLDGEGYRKYVVFSPDGKTLAGAGPKGIRFWNATIEEPPEDALPVGERPINVLPTDTSNVGMPEASPTSVPIATSSTTVPGINGLSYSPDGKELAIACDLGIWIYDMELNTEKLLLTHEHSGHKETVWSIVYSSDGSIIASGGRDGQGHIWDAKTKKHKFSLPQPKIYGQFLSQIPSLAFSPDSKIIVSGSDRGSHNQMYLWNVETGTYKYTLPGHTGNVSSVIFSPDGNTIVSSGSDKTILLWDLTSYPIVSISPASVTSQTVGTELEFDVNITRGKNLSGYQATIEYDPDSLEYVETKYGDFLSGGVPVQPIVNTRNGTVQLAALSLTGVESNDDGVLATIKFKVIADKASKLGLRDVILTNSEGKESYAWIDGAQLLKTVITEDGESVTCSTNISEDVNKDCVVNIQDLVLVATKFGDRGGIPEDVNGDGTVNIVDLVLVAGAFGNTADAPSIYAAAHEMISAFNVQQWLHEARTVNLDDPTFQRGVLMLEQLLMAVLPKETALLPNYPNPFNPETWIPYQLASPASVSISIYSSSGPLVRRLALGNQVAGLYQNRNRAAYWDGKNDVGESVSSGVYFYTLTAGEFSATRKMLILK